MATPAHWWKFEESDGSTAVDTIGQINGTLVNVSRISPGYSSSKAVHLTGADNSYVGFGKSVGQFGKGDFTVSFWVNTTETLRLFDLVGNRTASSHGNFFSVRMTGNHESRPHGMVTAEVDEDGAGHNYVAVESATAGLNDGRWHNIGVVRAGNTLSLYIDGALSASRSGAGVANIANGNEFRIGRSLVMNVPRFAPNALFDDLRIYGSAVVPNPGLSKDDLIGVIRNYAPIIQFHPQEKYLPSSVDWFLQRAWLCSSGSKVQASADVLPTSAPSDDHAYWLELKDTASRSGALATAKAYVHGKPADVAGMSDNSFRMFYPFNGPGALKAFPFSDRIAFDTFGEHTADWETFTYRVDNATKTVNSIYLSQHDGGQWITNLSQLTTRNGRYVIYASQNGHASYPRAGSNPTHESSQSAPWPFSGDLWDFYLINACADGGPTFDCAANHVLVSADYLGADKPAEPRWLNYLYRWGPHIIYPAGALDNFLQRLGVVGWLLSPLTRWIVSALPGEVKEEDGPTGPKTKSSWLGRPDA